MVTSRIALEELLQNRLTTGICKDTLRMQGNAAELFHLCKLQTIMLVYNIDVERY